MTDPIDLLRRFVAARDTHAGGRFVDMFYALDPLITEARAILAAKEAAEARDLLAQPAPDQRDALLAAWHANASTAEVTDLIDAILAQPAAAPTPCAKGCIEKETGEPHPAHVGRCNLPTGRLGVVSCYCTADALEARK
jgi:hypothetical protein